MYNYSKTEFLRKNLLLLKSGIKGKPANILCTILFIIRYSFHSAASKQKIAVYLDTNLYGRLYIRTHSSDLEVFFQHFIYDELLNSEIKSLGRLTSILDLGANIGFASLILAQMFPQAKIVAVEMEEANYAMLKSNCQGLISTGRLNPVLGAFYPKKGTDLHIIAGHLGDWHFYLSENPSESELIQKTINIITLDDIILLMENKLPELIKMDIEGGEVSFLKDDLWCNKVLPECNLILELHTFGAYDLYFHQLRKNNIFNATKVGEYWLTKKALADDK